MRIGTALALCSLVTVGVSACKRRPTLTFQSVAPASGRLSGGQEVRILGSGFESLGSLEVRVGGRPATNVGAMGDDVIVLQSPEGVESTANHPQDITILTADGRSIVLRNAWTYQPGAGSAGGTEGPNEDLRRRL